MKKLCHVADNYDNERGIGFFNEAVMAKKYTMPDKGDIHISDERFLAPEILFKPHLADVDC